MSLQVVSRVLAPAESYDLVELPIFKEELKITVTTDDAWLARVISQASQAIRSYCNRTFQIEQVQDLFYWQSGRSSAGRPDLPLLLSRSPLANYAVLLLSADAAAGDLVLNFADSDGIDAATIVSGPGIALGSTVDSNASNQVNLSDPLTAAMEAGTAIGFGIEVKTTSNGSDQGLSADIDYKVDDKVGQLLRLDGSSAACGLWNGWPITATYYAGYDTIPPDVEDAAVRLVTARWHARGRDPMLRERTHDSGVRESFWVGPTPGNSGAGLPDEILSLIEPYRLLVFG